MTKINVYLSFNGNCEAAFNFYKQVFRREFSYLGRFKDMPTQDNPEPLSEDQKEKIMHICLPVSEETHLMGSDHSEAFGQHVVNGNNFAISIETDTNDEAERLFSELSTGGCVIMPLNKTFWGAYFGILIDKFGIQWMIQVNFQE